MNEAPFLTPPPKTHESSFSNRQKVCSWGIGGMVIGSPLTLGSVHPLTQGIWAIVCLLLLSLFVKSRRGHHHLLSLPWLWGSLILGLGGLLTLIPLPQSILSLLSPAVAHEWKALPVTVQGWSSLSLSPIHTLHWLTQHWVWIWIAYMSAHFHSFRRPLLFCISALGPLLVGIGCLHSLLDLKQVYGLYQSLDRQHLTGMISGLINPNTTASLCVLSMCVALGLSTHWRILIKEDSRLNLNERTALILDGCAIVSGIGIIWSESRAALMSGMIGLSFLVWRRLQLQLKAVNQVRIWLLILGACGILFFFIQKVGISKRSVSTSTSLSLSDGSLSDRSFDVLSSFLHTPTTSALTSVSFTHSSQSTLPSLDSSRPYLEYPRFQTWADSLKMIRHYGIWGSGRGSFGESFTAFQSFNHPGWVSHPENHLLQNITEAGLIGFIGGIIWPCLFWFLWGIRSWKKAHDTAWGLWIAVGCVGLHQNFDFGFEGLGLSIPVAASWGLLWSYLSPSVKQSRQRRQRPKLIVLRLLTVICVMITLATTQLTYRVLNEVLLKREHRQSSFKTSELDSFLTYHPNGGFLAFNIARLLHKAKEDPLSWIRYTQHLMPKHGETYRLEAHYYTELHLYTLAQNSFRSALLNMPWKRRLLYKELNQLSPSPFNVLPKQWRGDFIYSLTKSVPLHILKDRILDLPSTEWSQDVKLRRFLLHYAQKSCQFDFFYTHLSSPILMPPFDTLLLQVFEKVCGKDYEHAYRLFINAPKELKVLPVYSKMLKVFQKESWFSSYEQ